MEVALFFCTVRAPSGRRTPDDFFGRARAHVPSTGFVRVSLPDFDDVASNGPDLPYLWRSYRKRPTGFTSKSLAIESCIVMDVDCHMGHLVGRNGAPREAIVFIHGKYDGFLVRRMIHATHLVGRNSAPKRQPSSFMMRLFD
jgi:hypothetical protein